MIDRVHYFIRQPSEDRSLVYPTELEDQSYYGFGAFYLLGREGAALGDRYSFQAVSGSEMITTNLLPYRNTHSFWAVAVPRIGEFVFYAQPLSRPMPYAGIHRQSRDLTALRRLRSWRPDELDQACLEHNFYFIGYSPRVA